MKDWNFAFSPAAILGDSDIARTSMVPGVGTFDFAPSDVYKFVNIQSTERGFTM